MDEYKPFPEGDIPWDELAVPAQRALVGAGFKRLEDFTRVTEFQVKQLHGIGPKALDTLRSALEAHGLRFATPRDGQD